MQETDDVGRGYFRRIDPSRVDNTEEIELAFRLQNSSPNDADLLVRLIDFYASDLYRWLSVVLYYRRASDPPHQQVMAILQRVFAYAITHVEQFHGQASAKTWLFGIAYHILRSPSFRDRLLWYLPGIHGRSANSTKASPIGYQNLQGIGESLRIPLILRYLTNFNLAEIAVIQNLQVVQVEKRLFLGRARMLDESHFPDMHALLQAYMDGLYDDDPDGSDQINQHIESCLECQSYVAQLNDLEKSLGESLVQRWGPDLLEKSDLHALAQSVLSVTRLENRHWQPKIKLGQVAWIAGISVLFIGLALVFIRLTPSEVDNPSTQATPPPDLPPITRMQPQVVNPQDQKNPWLAPLVIDPALSADGNWAVISYMGYSVTDQHLGLPTISLYDRRTNSARVISEEPTSMQLAWTWLDLAPSISADGQRVVYVTSAEKSVNISGAPCKTHDQQACLDIFLYDQATGTTRRLSQAANGGAADGDNLAPTISADGRWVAFWSAADNLVAGDNQICQRAATRVTCLYIYLENLQTGLIIRIPYRYDHLSDAYGGNAVGLDRISLSADGRYVGFTAVPTSPASAAPNATPGATGTPGVTRNSGNMALDAPVIHETSEAVVFDQQTGRYELENQAPDGTPGNGPSSTPVLSADGRYVAFASASSNLVNGDSNNFSDVFFRDRQTGSIELISLSSAGIQGNNNSGVTFLTQGYYSINMSADGRYIIFQSLADNLQPDSHITCSVHDLQNEPCLNLYVHDRQTGHTELISAVADQDFAFFPGISNDGRWVLFSEGSFSCGFWQYFCSDVMLYDQQSGWLSHLTQFNQGSSQLQWSRTNTLALPWAAFQSAAFAISTDGKLLAIGGHDSTISLWHLASASQQEVRTRPDEIVSSGGNDDFTALDISHNGAWLAAGTAEGLVYVWDLSNGSLLYSLKDQFEPVIKVLFSDNGDQLIVSTLLNTWTWTIGDGQLIRDAMVSYPQMSVNALAVSPHGNLLATSSGDGLVWLQDLPSGKVIARLGGQGLTMGSLGFSSDGSVLATGSPGGGIDLWKITADSSGQPTFTLLNLIQTAGYHWSAFALSDKFLASTGYYGDITLWSIPDGKMYTLTSPGSEETGYALSFSQSGEALAVVLNNEIDLWSVPSGNTSAFFSHATTDTFIDSVPVPRATAYDNPELAGNKVEASNLPLGEAAGLLNFPLMVPSRLPENATFLDASVKKDGSAILRYGITQDPSYQEILYIYEQAVGNIPPTMTLGASAAVFPVAIDTDVGQVTGEYVQGDWLRSVGFALSGDNNLSARTVNNWNWDNLSASKRLRWQQSGVLIALYYQVRFSYTPVLSDSTSATQTEITAQFMSEYDLYQVASGMKPYQLPGTGLACYISAGRFVSIVFNTTDYSGDRLCLSPSLVDTHFDLKYGTV